MIIINPIPGQEAKNTEFLLNHRVAARAQKAVDVMRYVDQFLRDPENLQRMRAAARDVGRPLASDQAAREILRVLAERKAESTVAARAIPASGPESP